MRPTALAATLLFAAALPAADPPPDPTFPKCPPGWKVELVAGVPKIKHPSVVCCAPDGRLFVGEDPMDMGNDSKKPTDRILCFHPGGRVTVFAENLHAVFGLAYIDGKLFVHHVPKFSVFTDDDGVGKDRRDLIDCTNPDPAPGFNDHIPSNMRLGMDGYFYVSTGDKGLYGAKGTDGRTAQIEGGGVFRVRPDGTGLEVYCTGTRNHLDVAMNAEDELFTYDNTDDGQGWWTRFTHMVDGGFYGYPHDYRPRRPYTLWCMTDYGGGSPTGAIAYNEDALPTEYHGNLFLCEWGRKQLLRLVVERDGGTYKVVKREDFLTAGTGEFRPVGIAVAPDGMSLYVTDWNFGGWKQDVPAGRLFKVSYVGGPSLAKPKPDWYVSAALGKPAQTPVADLVAGLEHPSREVRLVAQRRLAEKGTAIVKPVAALLADPKVPPAAQWSAIWTLDAVGGDCRAALRSEAASTRRQAARQLATRQVRDAVPELVPCLRDADATIRFWAATALGRIGDARAVPALSGALEQTDLFARYAAFHALTRIGQADPKAWPAIAQGLASPSSAVREGTMFALRDAYAEGAVTTLRVFVADASKSAADRAAALGVLAGLHRQPKPWDGRWWGTQPVRNGPPPKVVDWAGTSAVLAAVTAALGDPNPELRRAAIDSVGITRDPSLFPALAAVYERDQSPETRKAALRAVAQFRDASVAQSLVTAALADPALLADAAAAAERGGKIMVAPLLKVCATPNVPADGLARCLAALGALKAAEAVPILARSMTHADAKVRAAAAEALTAIGGTAAIGGVVPLLADKSPETRRAAVVALGAIKDTQCVEPLLGAFADPETRADAVDALANLADPRALDAHLVALASKSGITRDAARKSLSAVRGQVYPRVEQLAASGALSPEVVGRLQQVYTERLPIRSWLVFGPWKGGKPAANADWKPAKQISESGSLDLKQEFNPRDAAETEVRAEVVSPAAGEVELAGKFEGHKCELAVNGTVVATLTQTGPVKVRVPLRAGSNQLSARTAFDKGTWKINLTAPGVKGGPLFGASATKPLSLDQYAAQANKLAGSPERGRVLFADLKGAACIKCHKVEGTAGGDIGPSLAGVGAKYNKAQLVESVLYPSKQILDGYQQTTVELADGKVWAGIVRGETAEAVTLVDAEGRPHLLEKAKIDRRAASNKSLMPDGLQASMSPAEFADLVAYLESLKEKK